MSCKLSLLDDVQNVTGAATYLFGYFIHTFIPSSVPLKSRHGMFPSRSTSRHLHRFSSQLVIETRTRSPALLIIFDTKANNKGGPSFRYCIFIDGPGLGRLGGFSAYWITVAYMLTH